MNTNQLSNLCVALLAWAGFEHIKAEPWNKDTDCVLVTVEHTNYSLLVSGDDLADDYEPSVCLCEGLDGDGFLNVVAVWNLNANQIPVPLAA